MILQEGNTYLLEIPLTVDGDPIEIEEVQLVEFMFDNVRKIYGSYEENGETKTGDVTYDGDEHKFNVPLTQEETFSLMGEAIIEYQARVKFNDGSVNGTVIQEGFVQRSLSKEVL